MRLKLMLRGECEEMVIGNMSTHLGRIGEAKYTCGTSRAWLRQSNMLLMDKAVTYLGLSDDPIRSRGWY